MNKKFINGIIRVIISFSLIGLLFFIMRNQLADIVQLIFDIKITLFVLAMISSYIGLFFMAMRLRLFLSAQEIPLSMKEVIGLTLIGYFFNNFMPTAVGGDVFKAYYASKKTDGKMRPFTAILMDRFIGSFTLISTALFAFILLGDEIKNEVVIWPMWILFFIAIIFLLIIFNEKLVSKIFSFKAFKWLEKVHLTIVAFKGKRLLFLRASLLSLVAQFFYFGGVYFLIKGLYSFVPFIKILLILPIIAMISMFPSINGLGVREGAFLIFFKPLIGSEKAFALSLLWLFIYITFGICGGFIYAFARHGKRNDK